MSGEIDLLLRTIAAYELATVPDRDTFPLVFVESVTFDRWAPGAEAPASRLDGFEAWFDSLRANGVRRLQLAFPGVNAPGTMPGRSTFGFSNSSGGFLVAAGPHPERWRALWALGDRQAADRRIWRITFQGVAHDPRALLPPPPPLSETTAALIAAVDATRRVAATNGLNDWAEFFARAHAIASSPADSAAVAADVPAVPALPAGWRSPAALRLLHAARAANGFGAMGSWNDVGFSDPAATAAYEKASDDLFALMLHALVAGANAA
jgi:hypothetical protein